MILYGTAGVNQYIVMVKVENRLIRDMTMEQPGTLHQLNVERYNTGLRHRISRYRSTCRVTFSSVQTGMKCLACLVKHYYHNMCYAYGNNNIRQDYVVYINGGDRSRGFVRL